MRRRLIALSVLLALAIALLSWRSTSEQSDQPAAVDGSANLFATRIDPMPRGSDPAPTRSMRRNVQSLPRQDFAPLPALGLPVAAIYASLKARADQGDAQAACRLGAELTRCRYILNQREEILNGTDYETRVQSNRPAPEAAKRVRTVAHCAGLSDEQMREQFGFIRQAALAGNLAAIETYVSGAAMTQDLYSASYYLDDIRREAPRLAEAAAQAGSLAMVSELEAVFGWGNRTTLLGQIMAVPHNDFDQRSLRILFELANSQMMPGVETPTERLAGIRQRERAPIDAGYERAEKVAAARFQSWFAGKRQPYSLGGFGYLGARSDGRDFNQLCTENYIDKPLEAPRIDWQALSPP